MRRAAVPLSAAAADGALWFACTPLARLRGLGAHRGEKGLLVLAPCGDVHTFGMPAPIDVAFADGRGNVIETHRNVPPMRRLRCRGARCTVERWADPGGAWFSPGDRLALRGEAATE